MLLGEFPFLKSGRSTQLPENDLINMSLVWLLVADNAIQFVRYRITIVVKMQLQSFRMFFAIICEICWLTGNMVNMPQPFLT